MHFVGIFYSIWWWGLPLKSIHGVPCDNWLINFPICQGRQDYPGFSALCCFPTTLHFWCPSMPFPNNPLTFLPLLPFLEHKIFPSANSYIL
ncbi:hypothetical protein GE09DRAFT_1094949, partial [Coniochaeta sp. 2T2.1]